MSYFRFFPDVIWVKGKVRSTLYEITDRRVTQFSAADTEILYSFAERSIEETKQMFPSASVDALLGRLIDSAAGSVYEGAVYAEPYLPHMPFELKGYLEPVLTIDELTLELYPADPYGVLEDRPLLIFQGCNSCIPSDVPERDPDAVAAEICAELDELSEIPIRRVSLHIGQLAGHEAVIRQILTRCAHGGTTAAEFVMYLREIDSDTLHFAAESANSTLVICCTDAECLSETAKIGAIAAEAAALGVRTVLSVIYPHLSGGDPHSAVAAAAASLGLTLRTTELLRSPDDHVYSVGRGESRLEETDGQGFYARGKYSVCKYGKLAVNLNGIIGGCLHDRGTYPAHSGIFDFLTKNGHQQAWEAPKRLTPVCTDCENRFACVDCHTVEQTLCGHPEYLSMICGYRTDKGVWTV